MCRSLNRAFAALPPSHSAHSVEAERKACLPKGAKKRSLDMSPRKNRSIALPNPSAQYQQNLSVWCIVGEAAFF